MPDLFTVFEKRWKFILGLTLLAAALALVICLIRPKEYLSTATALPANSLVADKARVFNQNIEALYSDFGTPDELDRLEGTAKLDTIYLATVKESGLIEHYEIDHSGEALFEAVERLKKKSKINRSAYGELKIKVWDIDRNKAAEIANTLLKNLQELHQHLQNESNIAMLATLRSGQQEKLQQFKHAVDTLNSLSGAEAEIWEAKKTAMLEQLQQHEKMINQYQFAVNTNPRVLITVENARPAIWHDKPETVLTVLLAAFAAFALAFLLSLFTDSRRNLK